MSLRHVLLGAIIALLTVCLTVCVWAGWPVYLHKYMGEDQTMLRLRKISNALAYLAPDQLDDFDSVEDIPPSVLEPGQHLDSWGTPFIVERHEEGDQRVITIRCTRESKQFGGPMSITARYVAGDSDGVLTGTTSWGQTFKYPRRTR